MGASAEPSSPSRKPIDRRLRVRFAPGPRSRWIALFAVYALIYARTLGHDFVWDDFSNVVEASHFEMPLRDSLRATQHDFLDASLLRTVAVDVPYESYRPLLFLSYLFDDALFQRAAPAMHAHNLLLGALCIGAVGWVASLLLGSGAIWVAALFALHPLQTEAFCYVSARGDLLSALFALLATGCFLKSGSALGRRRVGWALGVVLAFPLSLAAKEGSAALPLALAVWALARGRLRASLLPLAALVGSAFLYAGVRVSVIGADLTSVDGGHSLAALGSLPAMGLQYLRIFFVPNDLSIERPVASGAWVALAWAVPGTLALLGAMSFNGAFASRVGLWIAPLRMGCAGLLGFFGLLAPAAPAAVSMGVAADRYATLPGVALALILVALWTGLQGTPAGRRLATPVGAWAALLIVVSALQVSVWRDNERLYRNSVRVESESSMAHYRVGVLRARDRRWDEAARHFERAVVLDGENLRALNNVGVAYLNLGNLSGAERVLDRTLGLSGDKNFRAWNNLATLRFDQQRDDAGCAALQRSLTINPTYAVARNNFDRNCSGASPAPGATGAG